MALNGLLAFVALNFLLLLSLWTKIIGVVSSALVVLVLRAWFASAQIETHGYDKVTLWNS